MSFSINGIPIIENVGTVGLYSGATDPSGWIICDGQPRTNTTGTYNNLYLQTTGKNYGYNPLWTNYGISSTINTVNGSITLTDVRGVAVSNVGTVVLADRGSTGLYISNNNGSTYSALPVSGTTTYGPYSPDTSSSNIPNSATVSPYSNTWSAGGLTWIATGSNWNGSANYVPSTAFASSGNTYHGWCPGPRYTTGGNLQYTVSNGASTSIGGGIGTVFGEWLQLQASSAISLTNFQIACELSVTNSGNSPGTFYLLGSNTGTGTWDPIMLCTLTSAAYSNTVTPYYTSLGSNTYCTPQYNVPSGTTLNTVNGNLTYTTYGNSTNAYQYFRMVTTTIASGGNGYLVILLNLNFNINTPFGNCPVSCVDISQDGTKIVAAANVVGQGLFLSTNTGSTWSQLYTTNGLPTDLVSMDNGSNKIAISNDGTKISVAYTNGFVYYSSNSGNNFQIVSPPGPTGNTQNGLQVAKNYWGLGMSKDGSKLVTAVNNGSFIPDFTKISFITNPGSGLPTTSTYGYSTTSYSGQYQIVTQTSVGLWISSNYGNYWSFITGYGYSGKAAISATGQYLVTGNSSNYLSISSTYGANWFTPSGNYSTVSAISANGQYILSTGDSVTTYVSSTYGNNFFSTSVNIRAQGCAMSSTGQYMYVGAFGGGATSYYTSNYGVNWQAGGAGQCQTVGMSSSGQFVLAQRWKYTAPVGNSLSVSSNYGVNFTYSYDSISAGANPLNVSYTGQIMIYYQSSTLYYSTNYGVNWTTTSIGAINAYISPNAQYLLGGGSTVQLATFPYWANGQNNVAKYWTKGPGGLTTGAFSTVNTSYTGQYIIAAITSGAAYLSNNYGQSWTTNPGSGLPATAAYYWSSISTTGQYIGLSGSNFLYLSSNFGNNWTLNPGSIGTTALECIAISGTGQYMLLSGYHQATLFLYLSTSYGNYWKSISNASSNLGSSGYYTQPAISQSGQYIMVGQNGGAYQLNISSDYGSTWSYANYDFTGWVFGIVFSGNGQYIYAWRDQIGASSDFGKTWRALSYYGAASESTTYPLNGISYTGQYVIITLSTGYIYSSNYGNNWSTSIGQGLPTTAGTACSISPNGNYMLYTTGSNMYMSTYKDQPWIQQQNQVGQTWSTLAALGSSTWRQPALSQNGQYIIIANSGSSPYLSSNFGVSFTIVSAVTSVTTASMSYSGQYIVCHNGSAGTVFVSSSYGTNFTSLTVTISSAANLACGISGNGQYMAVNIAAGGLYFSSNYGITWATNPGFSTSVSVTGIAFSATGQYIYAHNYASTDYGITWKSNSMVPTGNSMSTSFDGKYVAFANTVNVLNVSSNYGQTYTTISGLGGGACFFGFGMSYSGKYMVNGNAYSSNYGVNFNSIPQLNFSLNYWGTAISANGNVIISTPCQSANPVYISTPQNVDGGIAYSTDSGNNWMNGGGLSGPYADSVAISGDGSTLLANYYNDATYVSTGSANSFGFAQTIPVGISYGLALSSTGQYGIVTQQSGGIYTTTNYGSNFTAGTNGAAISDSFAGAASVSASGSVMIAGAGGLVYTTTTATNSGAIAFSTGSGLTINNPAITNIDIRGLATSNTGTILYADRYQNGLFLSVNSGLSWSQPSGLPSIPFSCVDISQDGTQMLASSNVVGYGLYVSSTSGSSWRQLYTANGLPTDLIANDFGSNKIAISNDGTKISVAYTNGFTYFSSNSGASFQNVSPAVPSGTSVATQNVAKNYWGLGMSKDGTKLVTAVNNGSYIPNINNIVWTTNPGTGLPASANYFLSAMSYSGQYMMNVVDGGYVYITSNYGNNWSIPTTGPSASTTYRGAAISANGQYISVTATGGAFFLTTTYGNNWITNPGGLANGNYNSCAISATGQYIVTGITNVILSSNYGTNFTTVSGVGINGRPSISATGQYISITNGTQSIISTAYGKSWITNPTGAPTSNVYYSCVSANGQYIAFGTSTSALYLSSNYGSSFSLTTSASNINQISMSYTGQFISIATSSAGLVSMSSSYGVYWKLTPGTGLPGSGSNFGMVMSANAQYILSAIYGGSVYLASNPYWTNTSTVATFNTTNWIQNQGAGQIWTKNPGGLPANQSYLTQSASYSGQYVLITSFPWNGIANGLYISTNYGTTFTKYTNPWGANTNYYFNWTSISSTGQYSLVTSNYVNLYMSTNYGASYFAALTGTSAGRCSISGNGQFLLFTNFTNTYISTNYGTNWSTNYGNNLPQPITSVGISYNGQYMLGNNDSTNVLWKSINYGLNWSQTSIDANSMFVNVSSTGQYMTYGGYPYGYISSNYGNNYFTTLYRAYNVAMSVSAQYMLYTQYNTPTNGNVYLSTNYGKDFTAQLLGLENLVNATISGNGDYMYISGFGPGNVNGFVYQSVVQNVDGGISYSTDSGNNWASILSGPNHNSVAISADGSTMLAGYQNNSPYLLVASSNTVNPLPIYPAVPPVSVANAIPYSNNYGMSLSNNGQYGIITQSNGQIYYTSTTGSTWQTSSATTADNFYGGAYISGNGQYITASAGPNLYTSLNSGSSFTKTVQIPQPSGITYVTYSGSSSTSQNWNDAAISSNGQYMLVASNGTGGGFLYLSTNSGAYWSAPLGTGVAYQLAWNGCAVSPSTNTSGYYVMAATVNSGSVYLSVNSGTSWTTISVLPTSAWSAISMSSSGSTIAVIASGSSIYVSSNAGTSFTAYGSALAYTDVAVSFTGQYIAATVTTGQIYVSTSFGTTWTPYATTQAWSDVYMSGSASTMIAAAMNGPLYISTNTGQAWTALTTTNGVLPSSANWANIGISSDATQLVATISGGSIYTSTNGGAFWSNVQTTVTGSSATTAWSNCLALSGNGSTILAGQSNIGGSGLLYVSINTLFTKTINTATWSANNIPTTIAVQSGTITLTDVRGIATSDVGTVVLADRAGTGIYISQNNGTTWSVVSGLPSISFSCVDISSDSTKIVAASNVVGYGLYLSSTSGSTWSQLYTANGLPTDLISMDNGSNKVAISNDGTKISVAYTNGFTYFSSNSGNNFQIVSPPTATGTSLLGQNVGKNYWGLGMSKDGTKLVTAVNNASFIPDLTKTSFVTNPGSGLPASATYGQTAISYNGQYQAVTQSSATAGVWISTNYGNNWTITTGYGVSGGFSTSLLSMSGNGQYIGLTNSSNFFTISSTYGANFRVTTYSIGAGQTAFSYTGQYIVCGSDGSTYYSTNYGYYFVNLSSGRSVGCGISSTGQYMVFSYINGVTVSSDYGKNWQNPSTGGSTNIGQVAVSGSGQYMFMTGWAGTNVYVSSTYGAAFYIAFSTSNSNQAKQASMSYTGQFMFFNGYYSSNYGVSWISGIAGSHCSVNATCQYILISGSYVQLANFPFAAPGQNYVGQVLTQISSPTFFATENWYGAALSYTGQYQGIVSYATTGRLYISSDYGTTWTNPSGTPTGANYYGIAFSSSGQYVLSGTTIVLLSTSYGQYWTSNPGNTSTITVNGYQGSAISSSGQYMYIGTYNNNSCSGVIYSSNYGAYWLNSGVPNGVNIQILSCSSTGQYILAPQWGGSSPANGLFLSSSYGVYFTFNSLGTGSYGKCSAVSASGQYMLFGTWQTGGMFLSSNYGINWTTLASGVNNAVSASISSSGQYMLYNNNTASSTDYFSTDFGKNWKTITGGAATAISGNAQYILTGIYSGAAYTSSYNNVSYWLQQNQVGQNWTLNPGGLGAIFLRSCALSANGQYILMITDSAAPSTYVSSNYGNSWTTISSLTNMYVCSMSYSGQYMVAGPLNNYSPYISSNYGMNWFTNAVFPAKPYYCARVSGNGQYILFGLTDITGNVYLSSDSGVNWKTNPGTGLTANTNYNLGGISYTGQYMFVTGYLSTNYGNNWTANSSLNSSGYMNGNMSGNGQVIFVSNNTTSTSISSNYGNSFFTVTTPNVYCYPDIGISYTGQYIFASEFNTSNPPWLSSSYGVYWYNISNTGLTGTFAGKAISPDGNYLMALGSGGYAISRLSNVDEGISYSTDSGNNWRAAGNINGPNYSSVSISGDGSTILAGTINGYNMVSTGTTNAFNIISNVLPGNTYGTAVSSTGQNAIVTQQNGSIYTTTSYGTNWATGTLASTTISDQFYGAASISQNGLVAGAAAGGLIYTSTSVNTSGQIAFSTGAGSTFNANNSNFSTQSGTSYFTYASQSITTQAWSSVSISSSGQVMAATSSNTAGGYLFLSTNTGSYWSAATTLSTSQLNFSSVAVSASNGQYILASVASGNLYVSANTGLSWTTISNSQAWTGVFVSSNGQVMAAVGTATQPYVSTNYGTTWSSYGSAQNYTALTVSNTGQYMSATVSNGNVYVSTNTGTSWNVSTGPAGTTIQALTLANTGSPVQTTYGNYTILTFNSSGTLTIPSGQNIKIGYIVVGGGGGSAYAGGAGGGVSYGTLSSSTSTLSSGTTYTVTVGAGGAGSTGSGATAGGSSSITGSGITTISATGGSPGASSPAATAGTGTGGAVNSSGGNGGLFTGSNTTTAAGSNGPNVIISDININAYYGGGGGAGNNATATGIGGLGGGGAGLASTITTGVANNGTANTGGGAGGNNGYTTLSGTYPGGTGGSGVVIIYYTTQQSVTTISNLTGISISSTGQYIIASANGPANTQALYLSNNFGLTWNSLNNSIGASGLPWSSVNMSSDGLRIVATTNSGYIYTSINGGATWTVSTSTADNPRAWQAISISGDGSKALAITNPGQVYTSTDGQVLTFTPITMPTTTTLDGTTLRYITKI
jgi:hypothetical protein